MAVEPIGTSVASEITKDFLVSVKRHARYFFCFNNIAKDLETKNKELQLRYEGFLQRATDAKNNTEQLSAEADDWLKKAKQHIEEADDLEEERKQKRKCCPGCYLNCIWQYRLGKNMAKKIDKVGYHHANTQFPYFSRLPTLTGQRPDDFLYFDSRRGPYDRLLEALRNDENFRIGLFGMGGLGKTSLVKEVQKEVMKSKSFNKVAFVVVSNPPNVRNIQEEIAESLGLELKEQVEHNRAERLYRRLIDGEKILLILDDVWHELDFNAIGIPSDNSHHGYCKVLLTTRLPGVCRSMDCQLLIELPKLSNEDAWKLFKKHAGIIEETPPTRLQALAQDIAEQCKGLPVAIAAVASTLKIHNLEVWEEALKTLKHSKPLVNIDLELEEKINTCLKLSYDNLKDKRAERLFLLCSLFPEDYKIPMEDLIRYGIGLEIFRDDDCYKSLRTQVHIVKERLINSCMLENASFGRESVKMHDLILSIVNKETGESVKMHDMVRNAAHSIANRETQVVMGLEKNLKAVLEDIRSKGIIKYLWLDTKMMHETPDLLNSTELYVLDPLTWPELKILVMIVVMELDFIDMSDTFFKGMESLQVLTLISPTWGPMASMRIPELINLQTLRLKCWVLGDISVIGNLKKLKILELEDCTITELPDGILGLKKLRLLDLFGCSFAKNPFGVIGRLSQLEELYFPKGDNFEKNWKVDGESISEFFDEKCCLRKLERYCIEIGGDCKFLYEKKKCLKHRSLYIQRLDASTLNATLKDLVRRAEILYLQDVQEGYKSIAPDIVQAVGGLSNELIELHLESCSEIQCLLDATNHSSEIGTAFSNLVELHLWKCYRLQNILFVGNLNLRNLKSVNVESCPALTSLFTLSIALSLELLEELTIRNCRGLKCIIADQRERENEDNIVQEKDESDRKIGDGSMFPKLNCIAIDGCDSLEWIFPLSLASGLQQLERIEVTGVAELKTIFGQYQHEDHSLHENPKEITLPSLREMRFEWVPNFISIFPVFYQTSDRPLQSINLESIALTEQEKSIRKNPGWLLPIATAQCLSKQLLNLSLLREINLSSIPKLVWLFKLSTAQVMLLEYLRIDNCHELKHIIANEQEDHDGNNYDPVIVFSKLRTLSVSNCSLLEMVLPASLAQGLLQLQTITMQHCPQLEYLFGHNDYLSREITSDIHIEFPALRDLILNTLPKMTSICSMNYNPAWPTLNGLYLSKCPLLKASSIIDCITKKESRANVIENTQSRTEVTSLENMLNFDSLSIGDDGELEGIFVLERLPSSWQQTQLSSKMQHLTLENLPKLRHICKTPMLLSFQNLGSLTVRGCEKLSYVFSACVFRNLPKLFWLSISDSDQLQQITEDQEDHKVCFPNLQTILIRQCNKLKSLFCSSNELPSLLVLSIKEASQLEEVFRHNMCNVEVKSMLPSLSKLELVKLPNLVGICHRFELHSVKNLTVEDCPKLPSTSTVTGEAFPHEHQNAADTEEEEIEGEIEVAVKEMSATELNKGKQPAEAVLTSNKTKDPQTSTNAGVGMTQENDSEEEEGKEAKTEAETNRVVQMAMVQTTTPMTDENAIHRDTMKGPSEIVFTNLINEYDHAGEKKEKGEVHIEVAQTVIHQDKMEGPSALTNPNEGRDTAPQTTIKNYSDNECKEAKMQDEKEKIKVHVALAETAATIRDDNSASQPEETDNATYQCKVKVEDHSNPAESSGNVISSVEEYATFTNIGAIMKHLEEKEGEEAKTEVREDNAPQMTTKGHSDIALGPSSETLLSSASLLPLVHTLPPQVGPSSKEKANFRDIGAMKKKFIPLLEEAITKYPSLWAWRDHHKLKHPKIILTGYKILGEMLEFLASTRWKDLTEDKKAKFELLVSDLETTFAFDIQWLEKTRVMIKQSRMDKETISRMQTLEVQVKEQQIEVENLLSRVQMAITKLNEMKFELDGIRARVENFNDFIGF